MKRTRHTLKFQLEEMFERSEDGRSWALKEDCSLRFFLLTRNLIRAFVAGKLKHFEAHIGVGGDQPLDGTKELTGFFLKVVRTIDRPLRHIQVKTGIESKYLKKLLREKDFFLIVKLHLMVQQLLWTYIEGKLGALPKQYQNWHFAQVLDLADAFNEIPHEIVVYWSSLNELRNYIAHKPLSLKFENIKPKYKATLYEGKGALHKISDQPDTDVEILYDWTALFVVSLLVVDKLLNAEDDLKR